MSQDNQNEFVLDLIFSTGAPTITERTIGAAEAFGIGVDETVEFPVFEKTSLRYGDGDLIYVTGDSGSGKSSFLRIFAERQRERGRKVLEFTSVTPDPDETLIENVGKDLNEAMYILSIAGLAEAFVMLRRYKELSEGQKYRYKLAKMINADAEVYVVDEFGATLDRIMAKVLAYSFQKWARKAKKQLVVASTHTDLLEDLNPDILIMKLFGRAVTITRLNPISRPFSLIRNMKIQMGTRQDYEDLKQFHYIGGSLPPTKHIFKLVYQENSPLVNKINEIVAIIIYALPFKSTTGRNQLFPEYIHDQKRLSQEVLRIARVIVNPKFRGIGIAHAFVAQCNKLVNARIVETLAVMAKFNPFFVKAGMIPVKLTEPSNDQKRLIEFIKSADFPLWLLYSRTGRKKFLNDLNPAQLQHLISILSKIIRSARAISRAGKRTVRTFLTGDLEDALKECLPTEKLYLYWLNPEWKPTLSP